MYLAWAHPSVQYTLGPRATGGLPTKRTRFRAVGTLVATDAVEWFGDRRAFTVDTYLG